MSPLGNTFDPVVGVPTAKSWVNTILALGTVVLAKKVEDAHFTGLWLSCSGLKVMAINTLLAVVQWFLL